MAPKNLVVAGLSTIATIATSNALLNTAAVFLAVVLLVAVVLAVVLLVAVLYARERKERHR